MERVAPRHKDNYQILVANAVAKSSINAETHVNSTDDLSIAAINPLIPPAILMENIPLSPKAESTVTMGRQGVARVLRGEDDRLVVVIGPCSIHDADAAREYGRKLAAIAEELKQDLHIIMRVYFEKPRTTVGWKGLINDPFLDGTFAINKGLGIARQLLLDINEMGLPCGVEFLDTISPQFIGDLVAWGAIGARTTESQIHRELASGLSCPVGFKNGSSGNVDVAAAAIEASSAPHRFLSVTKQGLAAIVSTKGNMNTHTILRGGDHGPNFDTASVAKTSQILRNAKVCEMVMIDFSHGNSLKIHTNQIIVGASVANQIAVGNRLIMGVMIESNLVEGQQKITTPENMVYGQSVTDACISFDQSVPILRQLAEAVRTRRATTNPMLFNVSKL